VAFACSMCVCIIQPCYCSLCRVHTLRLCRESAESAVKFKVLNTNLHYDRTHVPTTHAVELHCDLFAVESLSACGINKRNRNVPIS